MELSRDEFRSWATDMREDQRAGFNGMNARLDKLNGRMGEAEETAARHDERLKALEAESQPRITDRRTMALIAAVFTGVVEALIHGGRGLVEFIKR
jgi:hypothetical protein